MITYSYLLERDETDEVVPYSPSYPTELGNLVHLRGPNGTGKSTLLHLIALGCHGLKTGSVNETLRSKIRSVLGGDQQRLCFDVEITDRSGRVALHMAKAADSAVINLRDGDGKPLGIEQFERRFKLIYDIPDNPLARLPELLREIRSTQQRIESSARALRERCLRVRSDIEDARNPAKIAEREKEIQTVEPRKKRAETKVGGLEDTLKQVRMFTALKFYEHYTKREKELKTTVSKLKKEGRRVGKVEKKRDDEFARLSKQVVDVTRELEDLYHGLSPLLEGFFSTGQEAPHYELWREIVVRQELLQPELHMSLFRESRHFISALREQRHKLDGAGNLDEARLLGEMLALLERYKTSDLEIPGSGLSVQKFSDLIQAELAKHQGSLDRERALNSGISDLERILEVRQAFVDEILPKWKALEAEAERPGASDTDYVDDIAPLEEKLRVLEKSVAFYASELARVGIETREASNLYGDVVLSGACSELHPLLEKDLRQRIDGLDIEIEQLTKQMHKDGANLDYLAKDLEKLKKQEPHPYQDHTDALNKLISHVQSVEARLNQYDVYVKQLMSKTVDVKKADQARDAYFEHVFEYVGNRVGRLRFADDIHEVARIDLIKEEIVTTAGKHLRVDQMSTGQGQAAYLSGLLTGYDGRTMLALFDEVAVMDSKSMATINESLLNLYQEDKLLVGMVVQMADSKEVTEIC